MLWSGREEPRHGAFRQYVEHSSRCVLTFRGLPFSEIRVLPCKVDRETKKPQYGKPRKTRGSKAWRLIKPRTIPVRPRSEV